MTDFEYIVQDKAGRVFNADGKWWPPHISHQYGWAIRRYKTKGGAQRMANSVLRYRGECEVIPVVAD